jgi:transcriptional regulator with XRE-family HTH domain
MKRTNNIANLMRGRRQALRLTQRSLATKLRINAAHVSLIETGRQKPSLSLVRRLADVLGLNRQEVLLLARPETSALLSQIQTEKRPKPSRSWQRFTNNSALLARYHVSKHELQVLEHLNLLGTTISTKQFLVILTLIRDSPNPE